MLVSCPHWQQSNVSGILPIILTYTDTDKDCCFVQCYCNLTLKVHLHRHLYLTPWGHVNCHTLDMSKCFNSGQSTYNRLIHVHWTDSKKAYSSEKKWEKYIIFLELTMYIQLYLFTVLYFHCIATNMVKYLLYLVLFVFTVCIHSCVGKNWDPFLY